MSGCCVRRRRSGPAQDRLRLFRFSRVPAVQHREQFPAVERTATVGCTAATGIAEEAPGVGRGVAELVPGKGLFPAPSGSVVPPRQDCKELGLTPLVEAHTADEVRRAAAAGAELLGINARDLTTLDVDRTVFADLVTGIPEGTVRVAEFRSDWPEGRRGVPRLGSRRGTGRRGAGPLGDPRGAVREFIGGAGA
ncbi:hypothetical protein [Streptomyces europaeiscabiei]|uniref:hypothetical protein n=1 Tax=Streptomyces europaeiscabiei TaxID=146819 RepID=UPI0039908998